MGWLRRVIARVGTLFKRQKLEAEMAEEMRLHLELRAERNLAAGMSLRGAKDAAVRSFGGVDQIKERCRSQRAGIWFEQLLQDFRYGIRMVLKSPGFTILVVLILALGIGSNTAVFTVIDALLLRGLPVSHPEELVLESIRTNKSENFYWFPYSAFEQLRDHAQSVSGVSAFEPTGRAMVASGFGQTKVVHVRLNGVSGNFFSLLGIPASLGRTLMPDDDRPNASRPVVVLSYAFWQRQFGANPAVLGKTILVDKIQFTIAGVAAPGFYGVIIGPRDDMWMPIQMYPTLDPNTLQQFQGPQAAASFAVAMMGRLRPGVKRETANAEFDGMIRGVLGSAGLTSKKLAEYGLEKFELLPGGSGFINGRESLASLLEILMSVVGVVLVVACANVASLLLARAATRQHEFALRLALGVRRGRLIRQLMVESLLLAAIGCPLGLLFAHWGKYLLTGYLPVGGMLNESPDSRIVSFVIIISVATGVLVGLIPALRFSRVDLISALKSQAATVAGGSGRSLNRALVAAQIALSVCLMAGAGLFVRTLESLKNVDLGFNPKSLLVVWVPFETAGYAPYQATFSRDLLAALQALPGVNYATFSWGGGGLLSDGGSFGDQFGVVGYVRKQNEPILRTSITFAGTEYFETLGIPIIRGRGIGLADTFSEGDSARPNPVSEVVINESFARRYFGDKDPVGHQIHLPDDQTASLLGFKPLSCSIIGVAKDTVGQSLRDNNQFEIYVPSSAREYLDPSRLDGISIVLRTEVDPRSLGPSVRRVVHGIDPKTTGVSLTTMDDSIDRSLSQERMIARVSGSFSLFALLLASLGLYGVLAYDVTQRRREIGVRVALGASSSNIITLILRQGVTLTALGCAAGTIAAMALAHLISSQLYGISALDPLTFVITVVVLLSVALLACWLPARWATKVDPMIALRTE